MDNRLIRAHLAKVASLSQHLVERMRDFPDYIPEAQFWERLGADYVDAAEAARQLLRERRKATGGAGVCEFCGCTEADACLVDQGDGIAEACSWINDARTACSAPGCFHAHQERNRKTIEANHQKPKPQEAPCSPPKP